MEKEKIFRTKTGFCHITDDRLILTRDGVTGNFSKVVVGNRITRILAIYGCLSIALLYFAYDSYAHGDRATTWLLGFTALYLVYGIVKSRKYSATPIIERKDIQRVTYNGGIPGLTRPRFEVEFNDNGEWRKRLIMLPGTLSGGQSEAHKAVDILTAEKLLS